MQLRITVGMILISVVVTLCRVYVDLSFTKFITHILYNACSGYLFCSQSDVRIKSALCKATRLSLCLHSSSEGCSKRFCTPYYLGPPPVPFDRLVTASSVTSLDQTSRADCGVAVVITKTANFLGHGCPVDRLGAHVCTRVHTDKIPWLRHRL